MHLIPEKDGIDKHKTKYIPNIAWTLMSWSYTTSNPIYHGGT